nr:transposase [Treponema phagedenis]
MKQKGLFDEEDRLRVLSKLGDSLEKLNEKINWEIFKPLLKKALTKEPKGLGGRPAYDYVMMFKIIILQKLYNISDDQTEYQINDRLSFMRFLGLELKDKVPDAKTIWLFKEKLIEARVSKKLFEKFGKELAKNNLIGKEGTIIDYGAESNMTAAIDILQLLFHENAKNCFLTMRDRFAAQVIAAQFLSRSSLQRDADCCHAALLLNPFL